MSPQKLKLKSTLPKQDKSKAAKKANNPKEIQDFFGRQLGYFMIKASQKTNKISTKTLK